MWTKKIIFPPLGQLYHYHPVVAQQTTENFVWFGSKFVRNEHKGASSSVNTKRKIKLTSQSNEAT
jgi:hypothetical protein